MNNNRFRAAADVSHTMRAELLRMFPPRLSRVFCKSITMAYNVTNEFAFPTDMTDATVYAIHRSEEHEALLIAVAGDKRRPDGSRFFLTLSTAPGVAPVKAGEIHASQVEAVERGVVFGVQFQLYPLWQQQPEMAG